MIVFIVKGQFIVKIWSAMAFMRKEKNFKRVKNKGEKEPFNSSNEQENIERSLSTQTRKRQTEFGYVIKELSALTGKSAEQIKNECCLNQIQGFLSKTAKVIVRQDVTDKKAEEILLISSKLKVGEVIIAPAYLGAVRRIVDKNNLLNLRITLLIDFPFGESSFKSKLTEIKIGKDVGVDGVTVVISNALLKDKNKKELLWQCKKFSKAFKGDCSLAVSAQDVKIEQIKRIVSVAEKVKAKSVVFMFGTGEEKEIKEKLVLITENKGSLPISVLASVSNVGALQSLFSVGVDFVCTPYADEIGKELINKFKIS